LKVESVPVGCPIVFDFLPDIDAFYRDWLGRPLAQQADLMDLSYDTTAQWARKA